MTFFNHLRQSSNARARTRELHELEHYGDVGFSFIYITTRSDRLLRNIGSRCKLFVSWYVLYFIFLISLSNISPYTFESYSCSSGKNTYASHHNPSGFGFSLFTLQLIELLSGLMAHQPDRSCALMADGRTWTDEGGTSSELDPWSFDVSDNLWRFYSCLPLGIRDADSRCDEKNQDRKHIGELRIGQDVLSRRPSVT